MKYVFYKVTYKPKQSGVLYCICNIFVFCLSLTVITHVTLIQKKLNNYLLTYLLYFVPSVFSYFPFFVLEEGEFYLYNCLFEI